MRFTLTVDTSSDAFANDWQIELSSILAKVRDHLDCLEDGYPVDIRDHNGNVCGSMQIELDGDEKYCENCGGLFNVSEMIVTDGGLWYCGMCTNDLHNF